MGDVKDKGRPLIMRSKLVKETVQAILCARVWRFSFVPSWCVQPVIEWLFSSSVSVRGLQGS